MGWMPVLMYHEIETDPLQRKYAVSLSDFEDQVRCIQEKGYESPGIERGMPEVNDKRKVLITFDDGHRSFGRFAWPLLREAGFGAVLFVTTDFIDNRSDHLDWDELRDLAGQGVSIQSHGVSHRFLWSLNERELERELVESKARIEDSLGTEVRYLSCPGGRYDRQVLRRASMAGYDRIFISDPFPTGGDRRQGAVGRILMHSGVDRDLFLRMLEGGGLWRFRATAAYRTKGLVKRMLGDRFYYSLWKVVKGSRRWMD